MTTIAPTPPFRRVVPNPGFVLDVTVPTAWLFSQQGTRYTSDVMFRVGRDGAIVPVCWPAQFAEAGRAGERQGWKSSSEADRFLAQLCYFLIRIDSETNVHVWGDTLTLARTHNITAYNAAYLELAIRRGLPLATIDRTLTRAAKAAGVPIFVP